MDDKYPWLKEFLSHVDEVQKHGWGTVEVKFFDGEVSSMRHEVVKKFDRT